MANNIKRYYDASVLMSWNFATSLRYHRNEATVVACVAYVSPASAFSFNGDMHDGEYIFAWVFYFACSMIPGNAKASRRGTGEEFGTTLFLCMPGTRCQARRW